MKVTRHSGPSPDPSSGVAPAAIRGPCMSGESSCGVVGSQHSQGPWLPHGRVTGATPNLRFLLCMASGARLEAEQIPGGFAVWRILVWLMVETLLWVWLSSPGGSVQPRLHTHTSEGRA